MMNTLIKLSQSELEAQHAATMFEDSGFMHKHAPALFATTAHPKMSERYSFTNTYDILLHMHNRGFRVTSVMGGTSMYNSVMVRMRNDAYGKHHGGSPEFIVTDSHDGSKKLKLMLGYITFICMNGMIAGDILYAKSFIHLAPDLMSQVRLELDDIDVHVKKLVNRVASMRSYTTTIGERWLLADAAIEERFSYDASGAFKSDMRKKLLEPRRAEDTENDLYTVMNVVQENSLRGGISYNTPNHRVQRMRPISGVDRNMHINQRIWLEAERIMTRSLEFAKVAIAKEELKS
jgi:hypothetical protein